MTDAEFPDVIVKSGAVQKVEAAFGGRDVRDILTDLYHEQKLSQAQIARRLKVDRSTVVDWMKRFDVATGYNRAEAAAQ